MKRLLAFFLIITCSLTAGCWDQIEIIDLALVIATAIDKGDDPDNKVVLTIQVANPRMFIPGEGGGGDGEKAFWTATGTGKTISEATFGIAHRVPRRIFFGHNRLMIVGEEVARDGIIPYLDRYFRSRETRPNLYILVARGRGQEILETNMATFRSSGMTLINLLDLGNTHTVVPIRLVQFVYDLTSASSAAVAPMVQVVEQSSVNIEEMKEGTRPRTLSVKSLAVFNSGGRMVGEMNNAETMGLLWIRDWAELNELTVSYPIVESMESLTLDLVGSTTKTRVEIGEDGIPRFEIELRAVFDVSEHFGERPGVDHTWYIDSLEKRANTVIERDIQAAVSKAQALNADVLGFGEEVYRQHPREWERLRNNWPDIFPMVEVTVSSTSEINTRGMSAEKPDNLFEVLK